MGDQDSVTSALVTDPLRPHLPVFYFLATEQTLPKPRGGRWTVDVRWCCVGSQVRAQGAGRGSGDMHRLGPCGSPSQICPWDPTEALLTLPNHIGGGGPLPRREARTQAPLCCPSALHPSSLPAHQNLSRS